MSVAKKVEPMTNQRRGGAPTKRIGISGPRTALGLTQEQIAERMGSTQSHISKIEASDDAIQVSTLRAYAEAFGATLEVCITVDGLRLRVM